MKLFFWVVVLFGSVYSFAFAYHLLKEKNKIGAYGVLIFALMIGVGSFFVRLR
jgi:hypothetical protein